MRRRLYAVLVTALLAACTETTPLEVTPPITSSWGMWVSRWGDNSISSAVVEAKDTTGTALLAYACWRPSNVETIRVLDPAVLKSDNAVLVVTHEVQPANRAPTIGSDTVRTGPVGEAWMTGAGVHAAIDRYAAGWHLHLRYQGVERTWGSLERMSELVATARARCAGL